MKIEFEQIKKYIPSSWPLQSFIAINPLHELSDKPISEVIPALQKYLDLRGKLTIENYIEKYTAGDIELIDLNYAINEFIIDNQLPHSDDIATALTNKNVIAKLIAKETIEHQRYQTFANYIENKYKIIDQEQVRTRLISFCNDFFDLGVAKWNVLSKQKQLFTAWKDYALIEDKQMQQIIAKLGNDQVANVEWLLKEIGIKPELSQEYLISVLFQIIGWCSLIKWLEERPDNPYIDKEAYVIDIACIWLCYELLYKNRFNETYNFVKIDIKDDNEEIFANYKFDPKILAKLTINNIGFIWQRALEYNYQNKILKQIENNLTSVKNSSETPKSQTVFCIDTRSEGYRRYLEQIGNHKTFGFAGFFGIGFHLDDGETHSFQCPAIVKPSLTLKATPKEQTLLKNITQSFTSILSNTKSGFLSPFILFDAVGSVFGSNIALRSLFPQTFAKLFMKNKTYTNKSINLFAKNSEFKREEVAKTIQFVLNAIGLVDNFSNFVIIAAHQAHSENNPFQSSLDCGACGGNGGIPNTIAFCQAANDEKIRDILNKEYNICIPKATIFISACHDTTTDNMDFFNEEAIPNNLKKQFNELKADFAIAASMLRQERAKNLPNVNPINNRPISWSEIVPELALANNAAFIVAPRDLTKDLNLGRRTFLHSYDPDLDPNGDILNFIMNAPVLVGHFINSQYYFSTTDSNIYASGNKTIHNVVGGIGVMEGNFSDYKIGFPNQSLMANDELLNTPMRLLVIIYAKQAVVDKILENSPTIANIFKGRWAHLKVIEPRN